ncbi:arginine--tRNA ligase [Cysteiniphilum sp. QT6929]|uniref:arginine--tRNA ligase n=1 Tax=Cysteiniphilum sp. QT6929 TaxID=2975055 RepID=UPI0024B398EF|nr:arginine--tRNA ligase [Cysteiniphilum sp. QT6929]WHN66670.1 arginine--tRNA ligase [Cysteiniphilum sp. QT6929]
MTATANHTAILENYLTDLFVQAFDVLGFDSRFAKVQLSARPELGQFQCNGAMPLAKTLKKAPIQIANDIVTQVQSDKVFSDVNAVMPGFINITLSDDFLAGWSNRMLKDSRLGCPKTTNPLKVMMDFGGPNVAKPLHVGHIRSPLIGDCLQRVYRFYGDEVLSDVHLGDWGTQMGMLIEEIRKVHPNLPYFDEHYTGEYPKESPVTVDELSEIYPRASGRCKEDANEMEKARLATAELQKGRRGYRALWQHFVDVSIAELKKDYGDLGIYFDLWKGESDVQPIIDQMVEDCLKQKVAENSQGAIIIPVTENEDDKTPPLILVKSDGAVMYGTTDLATILERVEDYQAQKIIYVVDKRQSLHFKQVFAAAKKSSIAPETELVHIGFGTLNGKDGKPFKTRSGGVMRLSTLIDEAKSRASLREQEGLTEAEKADIIEKVALATVKFADLANVYTSDYIFDLDKFSQYEGKTGPYLLYSAVRIKSILRKLGRNLENVSTDIAKASNDAERNLQLKLTELPQVLQKTYDKCEPHHLCEYAYQVAVQFNKFYAESPIANEENHALKEARIALCQLTLKQLVFVLGLLGIEVPERM